MTAHSQYPPIRTYKPRRGRITNRQVRGLTTQSPYLLSPHALMDLDALFDGRPVVLEIGFGTGITTAQMAAQEPEIGLLAVDVHTPGVGDLVSRIHEEGLTNIRVISGDAIHVLEHNLGPGSLAGVRSFFPDPWPKIRHQKRRLVQVGRARLIANRVRVGGTWDLATDWAPYAGHIEATLGACPEWRGGRVERPQWRPITKYESLGLEQGRQIADFRYGRTDIADTL
ncbi:MAG: tRNA (guanine(46)-N(7))-methyltransferase TrmB [Actinomycetota bacterium]|nr:tRNA (guanine(46)-N(7))-methyltransferase TrmB [Actinomycetota bacterium]